MKKLLNKKGFTLMEMMIVIAIIVILVAIAVPSFNASLDKANAATDDANFRAAEAAALVKSFDTSSGEFYYDLDKGELISYTNEVTVPTTSYGKANTDGFILVTINGTGDVEVSWSDEE